MPPFSLVRLILALQIALAAAPLAGQDRVRARALGVAPGIFAPGQWNAITAALAISHPSSY